MKEHNICSFMTQTMVVYQQKCSFWAYKTTLKHTLPVENIIPVVAILHMAQVHRNTQVYMWPQTHDLSQEME